MRTRLLLLAVLAAAALTITVPCRALAVAISPGLIVEKNVIRGRVLSRSMTVFNTSARPETYNLRTGKKPVSEWTTLRDPATGRELTSLVVPPKSSRGVQVDIAIPATTANGTYKGSLNAEPQRSADETGTVLVPSLLIRISVTDKEVIGLQLESVFVNDIEVGMPLDIVVRAKNRSNVDIAPTLLFGVVDGDRVLRSAEFDLPQIGVAMAGSEVFNLELADMRVGKYRAWGRLKYGRVITAKQWIEFAVVPVGTFSNASLKAFRISGTREVGRTVKLEATFASKSPRALRSRLVADVYLDGLKIGSVEGDERAVDPFQETVITAPLKIQKGGSYRIVAYFVFAGRSSNKSEISFDAKASLLGYMYGAIALAAVGAGTGYYQRRRKRAEACARNSLRALGAERRPQ